MANKLNVWRRYGCRLSYLCVSSVLYDERQQPGIAGSSTITRWKPQIPVYSVVKNMFLYDYFSFSIFRPFRKMAKSDYSDTSANE